MRKYPCRKCDLTLRRYVISKLDENPTVFHDSEGPSLVGSLGGGLRGARTWTVVVKCDCGTLNEFKGEGQP